MPETKIVVNATQPHNFPLVVSFPQGLPVHHEDMQLAVGQKSSGKSTKTMISSTLNNVTYKGQDWGEYANKKDSCKFAVGVFDARSNKIKLIKADHVFVLKPSFEQREIKSRHSSLDYAQRRQSLTEEFGTRKKKRALQAEKSNTISTENIAGAKSMETIIALQSPSGKPGGNDVEQGKFSASSKKTRK